MVYNEDDDDDDDDTDDDDALKIDWCKFNIFFVIYYFF